MDILLLISICVLVAASASSQFCPVSSRHNTNQTLHGYPQSLFFPSVRSHQATTFNCSLSRQIAAMYLCNRDNHLCPVSEQNVNSALSVATWPQYVDAFERLGNNEHINVFYLGGSMTRGAETWCKCACQKHEDSRCPKLNITVSSESYCSWTTHITSWLTHSYSAADFHFHDFAAGGRTSRSADYFINIVRTSNANLSNPALIFLDYSVNDAQAQIFTGLEAFIRTIYANFGAHYNVRPTVVVLEQYPHARSIGTPDKRISEMNTVHDYAVAYRRIAKHYNAVLISFREIFWTYYGDPQDRNYSHPNLTHRHYPISPFDTLVHTNVHPPWYVHLYVADVLASCILRLSNSRTHGIRTVPDLPFVATSASTTTSTNLQPITTTTVTLPRPLYDVSGDMRLICDLRFPYAVDAIAHRSARNIHNHTLGWVEYVDTHDPGWIINNKSDVHTRTLSFPLQSDVATLVGHMLKISYLRSYEGMGKADVHLCGRPLSARGSLEGLWSSKVSIPDLFVAIIQVKDVERCLQVPQKQRSVDIVYSPGEDQQEVRSRHFSQFKIFTAHLCAPVAN